MNVNNFKKASYVLVALLLAASCSEDYMLYDVNQPDHLYFQETAQTHLTSFALVPEDDILVTPTVYVMGMPSDRDRTYSIQYVEAGEGETLESGSVVYNVVTARPDVDFSVGQLVIPAGEVSAQLPITLHRTERMLEDGILVKVNIRLVEDSEFLVCARDSSSIRGVMSADYVVYVNDGEPSCPSWWKASGGKVGWHWDMGRFYPSKYRRFLALFHEAAEQNPTFYEYCVNAYGYYLDEPNRDYYTGNAADWASTMMNTFWRKTYASAWAKYVFIPLYNYYKAYYEEHPDDPNWEPMGPGTISQGDMSGWSDPMDPGYGFFN